jgi:hypothetical protein
MKHLLFFFTLSGLISACDPHADHLDTTPFKPKISFEHDQLRITEGDSVGIARLHLDRPALQEGHVTVSIVGNGLDRVTAQPAITGGQIMLIMVNIAKGEQSAIVRLKAVDNAAVDGNASFKLSLIGTSGGFSMGNMKTMSVELVDNDIAESPWQGKPRSYEASAGNWRIRKTIDYNPDGQVGKIHTEISSPATSKKTQIYLYDATGHIETISDPAGHTAFIWTAGLLTRSETTYQGVLKSFSKFIYDENDNVSEAINYSRQPDGNFLIAFRHRYSYFPDGNLQRSQTYAPSTSTGFQVISTKTYDGYINAANPFPMVDIHPAVKTQHGLPTIHTIQEQGITLEYRMSYEFEKGVVTKRTSRYGNTSEDVFYTYY